MYLHVFFQPAPSEVCRIDINAHIAGLPRKPGAWGSDFFSKVATTTTWFVGTQTDFWGVRDDYIYQQPGKHNRRPFLGITVDVRGIVSSFWLGIEYSSIYHDVETKELATRALLR